MDLIYTNGHDDISTDNASSGTVSFEANTNPLYEFTNADSKMESDSSNPLYELNNEPVQKEAKSEPSNLLYEYMQSEGQSNGHSEDGLTNGAGNEVDLLGGGDNLLEGGSTNVSAGDTDLLGDDDSQNVTNDKSNLLEDMDPVADKSDLLVDSEPAADQTDLLGESEPVVAEEPEVLEDAKPDDEVNDNVDNEPGETTQVRSRSNSEGSEPEQEIGDSVQNNGPISDPVDTPKEEIEDQFSGPLDNEENGADKIVENADEVSDEGTNEQKADVERSDQAVEEAVDEPNSNETIDEGTIEAAQNKSEVKDDIIVEKEEDICNVDQEPAEEKDDLVSELVEETDEQFDDAEIVPDSPTKEFEADTLPAESDVGDEMIQAKNEEINENETAPMQEEQSISEDVVQSTNANVKQESNDVVEDKAEPEAELVEDETVETVITTPSEDIVEETTEVPEVAGETENVEQVTEEPEVVEQVAEEPEVTEPEVKEPEVAEQVAVEPEVGEQVAEEPEVAEQKVEETKQFEQVTEEEEAVTEQIDTEEKAIDTLDHGDDDTPAVVKETEQVVETTNSAPEENALKVNGASEISENGISEEEAVRDPDIYRETHEKEEIHFAEMNNVRQKFESGKTSSEELTPKKISVKEEYDQGGEFENEPVRNPDVVREADQQGEDLPEVGTAKNLVSKFKSISEEKSKSVPTARPASPPRTVDKVEYESQPSEHLPQYEAKVESGVFESEPKGHEEVVVRSGDQAEDYKPEQGYAKNILNKFKEIQTESSKVQTNEKRELTPDRSGKIEYVSEPRGERIEYSEAKSESGVFENVPKSEEDVVKSGDKADEVLPEIGYAKSVLSKFKQMESEVGNKPPPSPKKDSTPDKSGRVEYVSEPRGYLERYEPQTESGEFENQPEVRGEVIKSGEATEEVLPEVGAAKKTMERFKEIQKQSSSPVSSSSRSKAMTPPREVSPGRTVAGVVENQPAERDDVVKSGDNAPELLPEQGTTRNILNKFKEIQSSGSQTSSPGRKPKEFTPPPEAGVYENTPKEHLVVETRQSESGVLESTPSKSIADVAREREASPEAEMPEQGYAKNMVSKWRQLESTSAKSTSSTSPRYKEFTPPRDNRGPLSPKSPVGVTNGVHPSELPGQYQPQESSVIVENNPKVNEGIYREADTDWSAGMPAPNTTSSMLQKFKQIQSKAKEDESSQVPIAKKS